MKRAGTTIATWGVATSAISGATTAVVTMVGEDAPKALLIESASTMTMVGAAIGSGIVSIAGSTAFQAEGAAISSGALASDTSASATLGGSTTDTFVLNHFNGADGADATTSADEVANVTWSQGGGINATLTTAIKHLGTASVSFTGDGTVGAFIKTNDIGIDRTGDWTLEYFGRINQSGTDWGDCLVRIADNAANVYGYLELWQGTVYFIIWKTLLVTIVNSNAGSVAANTFYHVAMVHDSVADTFAIYFNGNRINLTSSSDDIGNFDVLQIDLFGDVASSAAWLDEVRITNKVKYSGATYTVPTAEFSV